MIERALRTTGVLLGTVCGLTLAPSMTSLVGAETTPFQAVVNVNQHGLTGWWYQPATSGQGIEFEIYPNVIGPGVGFLQGSWDTYEWFTPYEQATGLLDASRWPTASGAGPYWSPACGYWDGCLPIGGPRWYTFSGKTYAGAASSTLTLYQNVGGKFNALPATFSEPVGTVVLAFDSCTAATMEYTFTDGSGRHGLMSLQRLTPNVTCSAGTETSSNADFGFSGNWFDPTTSGQGFFVELNPNAAVVLVAWYTYTWTPTAFKVGTAAQRWYTGQGEYLPGLRTLPITLYESTGGLFNSPQPPANTVAVGNAVLKFFDCDAAELSFTFTGGNNAGQAGTIHLSRAGPKPAVCAP